MQVGASLLLPPTFLNHRTRGNTETKEPTLSALIAALPLMIVAMSGPKQSNGLRITRAPIVRGDGVWDARYNEDPGSCIILPEGYEKRVNFEESKLWIRDCMSRHTECKTPARTALIDLRVLDCHNRVIVAAPKDCAYVALSYVWGRHTPEDTPQFPRLPDKLPRTVEDSIEATIRLGYRYLWIDRHV